MKIQWENVSENKRVHAFRTYFLSIWEYGMIPSHSTVWGKAGEYFRTSAQESLLLTLRR